VCVCEWASPNLIYHKVENA